MRPTCLALLFLIVFPNFARGEKGAEVIRFGNLQRPGVKSTAATQSFEPQSASVREASSGAAPSISLSPATKEEVVLITNRCSATNLGDGFSYSFANGVECASFSAPVPGDPVRPTQRRPRAPSPEEIAARLFDRAVALAPAPELEVAPSGVGLAGLRTFFWLAETPEPIVATAAAGPATVTAVADPVQYLWDFGDGGDRLTQTSGTSWTPRRRGSIGHVYQASGRYDLDVEVIWEARWRSGGGTWQPLGYFSTSDSRPYRVREVIAWLVRQR
jgi:hypothetical protein